MYPVLTLRSGLCLPMLILSFVLRLDILSNIKLPINIVYAYPFSFTTAMPTVQFILQYVMVLTIAGADYFTVQLPSSFISAPKASTTMHSQLLPWCDRKHSTYNHREEQPFLIPVVPISRCLFRPKYAFYSIARWTVSKFRTFEGSTGRQWPLLSPYVCHSWPGSGESDNLLPPFI